VYVDSHSARGRRHDGPVRVASSDHVSVAVHEFGGTGRPLLLSHATGFHGYSYLPIADELSDEFTSFALDYRGHGDTARPDDWEVDWARYGDDALAAARAVAPDGGLVGFGHSMGGAGLLMAAHRDPSLFDLIVAFEPIVFPPREADPHDGTENNGNNLSKGARKRRASFDSFGDAIANYSSKPPMMAFDPDVLRLYVAHGFRPSPEGVRLKCDPEHEARTFDTGGTHTTWADLPEIGTNVVIVAGKVEEFGPAAIAREIAGQLPNASYIENDEWNHFTPFIDPGAMASVIRDATPG
jgi:pimeloyl-ACP methyl ester carboxylesterase